MSRRSSLALALTVLTAMIAITAAVLFWPGHPTRVTSVPGAPQVRAVNPAELLKIIDSSSSKLVLLNVWATWCEPCREEFPALLRLRETHGPLGLELILVSADTFEDRAAIELFLREQKVDFATYVKSGADETFISALFKAWNGALPTSALFRPGHREPVWFHQGDATYEEFAASVERFLAKP